MARKSVFNSDGPAVAEFNMTPMIDVTFQLILFFILVGQVASDALAKLILPEPGESTAQEIDKMDLRIILNIVSQSKSGDDLGTDEDPDGNKVGFYSIGGERIDARQADALKQVKDIIEKKIENLTDEQRAEFAIEIRADKRLRYDEVAPAMFTVSSTGLSNMQITAIRKQGNDGDGEKK